MHERLSRCRPSLGRTQSHTVPQETLVLCPKGVPLCPKGVPVGLKKPNNADSIGCRGRPMGLRG